MAGILEQIILGFVQGLGEWIPISSEGLIFIIKNNFYPGTNADLILRQALLLHLGTFFAALIYLRSDVLRLFKALFSYKTAKIDDKKVLTFLVIATLISGILGFALMKLLLSSLEFTGRIVNLGIGLLLIVTAFMQLKTRKDGSRHEKEITNKDSVLLGFAQGFSVLPGLSRSGLTISGLLFRGFDKTSALRLSFLLSLPIVLAGNIIMNFKEFSFISEMYLGVVFSFIFGLLSIHAFIKISEKVNFGYFVGVFGALMIVASLL